MLSLEIEQVARPVVFAVFNGASSEWTWTELGGLAGYGLVAWIGAARFAPLVGVGWLLHVLWDVALHPGGHPRFVPWVFG